MDRRLKWAILVTALLLVVSYGTVQSLYKKNYDAYIDNYVKESAESGTLKLKVKIESKQTAYHNLGTDITKDHTLNGVPVKNGDIVAAADVLRFTTTITEDDGTDDKGTGSAAIYLPSLINSSLLESDTISITVRERGGRKYPNAYATWDVTYTVTPYIDKDSISYWDVVFFNP